MKETTLCYIENSGRYLMLLRNKKKNDPNMNKWIGVGGKLNPDETPIECAKREIFEEGGVIVPDVIVLKSMCHIPVNIFPNRHLYNWSKDMYVIPEYSFGFECEKDIVLSHEHTECVWLTYEQAKNKLKWDSNKTALYELNCQLINKI